MALTFLHNYLGSIILVIATLFPSVAPSYTDEERERYDEALTELQEGLLEADANGSLDDKLRITTQLIELHEAQEGVFYSATIIAMRLQDRSAILAAMGDWVLAEADLLEAMRVAKNGRYRHDVGERENDLFRVYRSLAEFYLSTGNLKRAYQGYDAARYFRRESIRKRNAAVAENARSTNTPEPMIQALLASTESYAAREWSEGNFLKRLGVFGEAGDSLRAELQAIDRNWEFNNEDSAQSANRTSVVTQHLQSRIRILLDLAELSLRDTRKADARVQLAEATEDIDKAIALIEANPTGITPTDPEAFREAGLPEEVIEKMEREMAAEFEKIEVYTTAAVTHDLEVLRYLKYVRGAEILFQAGDKDTAFSRIKEGLEISRFSEIHKERSFLFPGSTIRPEEAFRLYGDISAALGETEEAQNAYAEAKAISERSYPENHPVILEIEERIAFLAVTETDGLDTSEIHRIIESRMESIRKITSFGTDRQRLAYRSTFDLWGAFATLGRTSDLADMVVGTKGVILESILDDRNLLRLAEQDGDSKAASELRRLRRELMEVELRAERTADSTADRIQRDIAAIEQQLRAAHGTEETSSAALAVSYLDVASSLPDHSVVADFISYQHYHSPGVSKRHYGTLIFRKGQEPVFLGLGPAESLDLLIEEFSARCRNGNEADLEASIRKISGRLLDPLSPYLGPETESLIISPDGSLAFVPFGILLTAENRFLVEDLEISYVINSRRLLTDKRADAPPRQHAVIVSDPDFDSRPNGGPDTSFDQPNSALAIRGGLGEVKLPSLPGTRKESLLLKEKLESDWGWQVSNLAGNLASETELQKTSSPGILHLATHGFFLPDTSDSGPSQEAASAGGIELTNPMHRGGIALSGANRTLEAWGSGVVENTASDGIISAMELADLDLTSTWLVVLSACDTGVGEAVTGEGVLGIRHGLRQAGADNLLLTLWPVGDLATVNFMETFYEGLAKAEADPAAAITAAQVALLTKTRAANGLAHAVRIAGPFVLSR
ncbi:MAG: CHAT domain-containing protein [Verrucomicrobiota bacterium]